MNSTSSTTALLSRLVPTRLTWEKEETSFASPHSRFVTQVWQLLGTSSDVVDMMFDQPGSPKTPKEASIKPCTHALLTLRQCRCYGMKGLLGRAHHWTNTVAKSLCQCGWYRTNGKSLRANPICAYMHHHNF